MLVICYLSSQLPFFKFCYEPIKLLQILGLEQVFHVFRHVSWNLIGRVRTSSLIYMRTFNIILDLTHKIYQEMTVTDGVPHFHPPQWSGSASGHFLGLSVVFNILMVKGCSIYKVIVLVEQLKDKHQPAFLSANVYFRTDASGKTRITFHTRHPSLSLVCFV